MPKKEEVEHGPELCAYAQVPGSGQVPYIMCLCGWESWNGNKTWAELGEEFDQHLSEETPCGWL